MKRFNIAKNVPKNINSLHNLGQAKATKRTRGLYDNEVMTY